MKNKLISLIVVLILSSLYIIYLWNTPPDPKPLPAYKVPVYTPVAPVIDNENDYDENGKG